MIVYVLDGAGTAGRTSRVIDDTVRAVVDGLNSAGVQTRAQWVSYPASIAPIGGNYSWAESSRIAQRNLADSMKSHNEDIVLLAYSAGNMPAHEFLRSCGSETLKRVKAVGLMSDPWRPRGTTQAGTPTPSGYGVMGEDRGPIPSRTFWTSVEGDAISGARSDALIRYIGDLAVNTPDGIIEEAIRKWSNNSFQLAWQLGVIQKEPLAWFVGMGARMAQLRVGVERYLGGWHTTHYTRPFAGGDSLAVRMGKSIAWKVKKDYGLINAS